MRVRRFFLFFFPLVIFILSVPVLSQTAPATVQTPEVAYGDSWVEWSPAVANADTVLTMSGPEGLYLKQEQPAGSIARFSLRDDQGRVWPDGIYKWELNIPGGQTRSGWFEIRSGKVTAEQAPEEKQPVVLEPGAPANSLYVDREGRVGLGTSIPAAHLHLKGTNPSVAIEDTATGGREYRLRSRENGDGSLGLFEEKTGEARWLVDADGRMGINTTKPTSTLTVDGYIETTKGFLVNGRPIGAIGGWIGVQPLATESYDNSFFGTGAGAANTGSANSFFGAGAGGSNTTGGSNSFFGRMAGRDNTEGSSNCFFGGWAGQMNTSGYGNSFFGAGAGSANTAGPLNSSFGREAGYHNTVESGNSFLGAYADLAPGADPATNPVINATAVGFRSYVSRSNSVVLGAVNGFNGATTETFVGIGTTAPDRQLVVEGNQALGKFRRLNATTPTHAPAFLFERGRGTNTAPTDIVAGDYLGKVQFRGRLSGNYPEFGALAFIATDKEQNGRFSFLDRDLVTERMVIWNTGNVGIGTTEPTELLDVAGNLRVRGGIAYGAPTVPVPDYVFESSYRLRPLAELERYVRSEKHLPNIPKASEIQDQGVNVGEFQMKLLEKIEELTLYAVEQAKANDRLKQEAELQKRAAAAQAAGLTERIEALEALVKTLLEKDGGRK